MFSQKLTPKMIKMISMNKLSYGDCKNIYEQKKMNLFGYHQSSKGAKNLI